MKHICVICEEPIEGYGNNARPYAEGRCCDVCNVSWVIPHRIRLMRMGQQLIYEEWPWVRVRENGVEEE